MIKNLIIVLLVGVVAVVVISSLSSKKDLNSDLPPESVNEMEKTKEDNTSTTKPVSKSNSLDLSGQGLQKLPESVLSNTSLEELDISDNNLTGALPGEIRFLTKLKVLNASNNRMTGVPAEVGQLSNLEVLDLSNNQLTGLPNEMANLKNLKTLNLSGNDYSVQDLEIIKQGLRSDVVIIL